MALGGFDWFNLIAGVAAALLGWRALSAKTDSAVPSALGSFLIWLGTLYVWQAGSDAFVGKLGLSMLIFASSIGLAVAGARLAWALWRLDKIPTKIKFLMVSYLAGLLAGHLAVILAGGQVEVVTTLGLPDNWVLVQLIAKAGADSFALALIAVLCGQSYIAAAKNQHRFEGLGLFTVGFLALIGGSSVRVVVPVSGTWDTVSVAHAIISAGYQLTILVWVLIAVRNQSRFAWKIVAALTALVAISYFAHFVAGNAWVYPTMRVVAISLLAIATLRGHVEGMDAQLRFGISKSAIAAIFVAVFFIASEGTQAFFGETFQSEYMGIAAAGLLVLGISPLMRWADQLAIAAVPVGTGGDPAQVYLESYRTAMADGTLSPSEERHLADLAERLGLGQRRTTEIRLSEAAS